MTLIAIIPARSGSKGLKDKNILNLCGKPLIAYSIEAALEAGIFDRIIVSTNSYEYGELALIFGSEVIMRSEELSNDAATSYMVIEDVLEKIGAKDEDIFCLLQPTSPLRTEQQLKEAYSLFIQQSDKYDFSVSVSESGKSRDLIHAIEHNSLKKFDHNFKNYSRQKYKEYYPNGAIFIGKVKAYLEKGDFFGAKSLPYYMNEETSVDIDTVLDFQFAITIINNIRRKAINDANITKRIEDKLKMQKGDEGDLLLLGHSIMDNWDYSSETTLNVKNWGINGITVKGYLENVIRKNLISHVPDICVIMLGINDIKYDIPPENIGNDLQEIIDFLNVKNAGTAIYLFDVMNVNSNIYVDNEKVNQLNDYLHQNIMNVKGFIPVEKLNDQFNKLDLKYTTDGVHLNQEGYQVLTGILKKQLCEEV